MSIFLKFYRSNIYKESNFFTAAGPKSKVSTGKLRFALDMEDCLDRFYGGYYSGMDVLFVC